MTDKPKQRNPMHRGGEQLKEGHENTHTGRPPKGKPGLAEIITSGLICVQMPHVMKAITEWDDRMSNEDHEQELTQ